MMTSCPFVYPVYWDVLGTAPNRELVIEWRNALLYYSGPYARFEVVFFEANTNILFNYADVGSTDSTHGSGVHASIGVQVAPNFGTQFSYMTPSLTDQMALLWQLVPPVNASPESLSFGNQPVGTASAAQTVTLTNSGAAPVNIAGITTSDDFPQSNDCPASLAPAGSCVISVAFAPTTPGAQTSTLTIIDNALGSPHVVNLSGTGIGPVTSLSTNTLSFPGQIVGTTSPVEAVTLTNSGNAPLAISSITATGDYALTHNCVSPLAAEASCALSVTFTPTVGGGRGGTLIITDDAAGSPRTVSLSGVGQDFTLGAFTTARAVSPGMTARFDLLLSPQGGFNQTVSLACSGAPAGATCSVRPSSVTPNGVNNVSVALEVVTTAPAASTPRDGGWRRSLPPGGWPVATTLALLGALALLAGAVLRRAASSARLRLLPVLGVCLLLVALVWAACGGGGLYVRSGGTPAGTYMLTITATASNVSHGTTVKLTVR